MRTHRCTIFTCLFLLCAFGAGAGEAKTGTGDPAAVKKKEAPPASVAAETSMSAGKTENPKNGVATMGISASESLVLSPSSEYVVVESVPEGAIVMEDTEVTRYVIGDQVAEYDAENGTYVFPNGEFVTVRETSASSHSPYWSTFGFDNDYKKTKGFVVYANAGYKWAFLRKIGFDAGGHSMKRNLTISGGAAALGLGYSFGEDVPIALEVDIGLGPNLDFYNRKTFGTRHIDAKQKINIYNLDASIDYDIRTNSPVTPFIGINTGLALVSNSGRVRIFDNGAATPTMEGGYKWKHRVNLMGGMRLGARAQIHKNIILSAVAEYNYLGDIQAQQFTLSDGSRASTNRIKAHEFNLKLGVHMKF